MFFVGVLRFRAAFKRLTELKNDDLGTLRFSIDETCLKCAKRGLDQIGTWKFGGFAT